MADTAIVLRDSRLLLFQALGHSQFGGLFFEGFKKEGAGMAYEFAQKYYTITSEPNLTLASYCVLGVCNLGLVLTSENQLHKAILHLQTKTMLELFQLGWAKISQLVRMKNFCEQASFGDRTWEIEKELAERFSAEPDKIWIGLDEYNQAHAEIEKDYLIKLLRQLLDQNFIAKPKEETAYVSGDEFADNSLFASILLAEKMHAPLKPEEFENLYNWFKNPQILSILHRKLKAFSKTLPYKLRPLFMTQVEECFKSKGWNELAKYAQQDEADNAETVFYSQFYIESDPDKISAARYERTKANFHRLNRSFSDLQADLERLHINITDISEKMAIIDLALDAKYVSKLTVDDLEHILKTDELLWQNKINWLLVKDGVFSMLVGQYSGKRFTELVLEDFTSQIDLKKAKPDKKLIAKIQFLTGDQLYELCQKSTAMRDFLLTHISRNPKIFSDSMSDPNPNILFIPLAKWPKLWTSLSLPSADLLFSELRSCYHELKIARKKADELFFQRVLTICRYYQRDLKKKAKDYPVCEAPYYNRDLKKAVARALLKNKFETFSQKLSASL